MAQVSGQTNLITPIKSRGNTLRLARWADFKGIDNIHRPEELPLEKQVKARNVYVNDRGKYRLRPGQTLRLSGNIHSLFTHGKYLLAIRNQNLVAIDEAYNVTILKYNVGPARMSFTVAGTWVIFTNNTVIGYIKDLVCYDFSDVTTEYKIKVFPASIVRTYRGRVYLAKDNVLWFTDAGNYGRIDTRKNFILFPEEITMVEPADDGLFISSDAIYFLAGASPEKMEVEKLDDGKAVKGTSCVFDSYRLGGENTGKVAVWLSDKGVSMGMQHFGLGSASGRIVSPMDGTYSVPSCEEGAGFINTVDGLYYTVTLRR